jgi:hypothetical protein
MSFYSALVLAANDGIRKPSREAIQSLLGELGLFEPGRFDDEFGNLAHEVIGLFADEEARAANDDFFRPDSISYSNEIEIQAPDGDFTAQGCSLQIHGYGYFWPWDMGTLRARVVHTPKLQRLRQAVQERYGGRFVFPAAEESMLRERWIDGDSGWLWFSSESL